MKFPLTKHTCMVCGWGETNHRCLDGRGCPTCGGPLSSNKMSPKKEKKGKQHPVIYQLNSVSAILSEVTRLCRTV